MKMTSSPNSNQRQNSNLFTHYSKSRNHNEKVSIKWTNLSYSVIVKDPSKSSFLRPLHKNKRILRSLHGSAVSGELLAIMGPTGCGKTSLLNVLAARVSSTSKASTELTGEILINGKPRNDSSFRKISAYVLQDDRLYAHLTVYETLLLAAHFFLPNSVTLEEKETLVSDVIAELGLGKTRNTIIGDEKVRGVSGGERKRANIAVQLISDPAVMFLDEPTSGLDSFQAQAVMESMKCMALNGRLIVTVIHQPRSSIFDMFDRLLLLSEGRTMYLGSSHEAAQYFLAEGFACPKFFNPADFFLDVLSPDHRTAELEQVTGDRIQRLGDAWAAVPCASPNGAGADTTKIVGDGGSFASAEVKANGQSFDLVRLWRNLRLLFWRSWIEQTRNIGVFVFKCVMVTFFALVIGGIYSNIGDDQTSIRNRQGLLFVVVINQAFNGVMGVLNSFPKEKLIVNRERSNDAYDTLSYFLAKFFAEMPLNLVPCLIFGCIVYWLVGLNPDTFGQFLLILMMQVVTAISLGLAVSAFCPTPEAATTLGVPMVIIPLIFGGFYINIESLPIVANWLPYVSFLKWAFQAFCINEFSGQTYPCDPGAQGCLSTGSEILATLSFQNQTVGDAVFGLGMLLVGFLVSAVVILDLSRLTYTPLGHVGGMHIKHPPVENGRVNSSEMKAGVAVAKQGDDVLSQTSAD